MSNQKIVVVGAGASARIVAKTLKANKADVHITVVQPNKFASLPWYQTLVLTNRDSFQNNATFETVPGADKTVYGVAAACSDGILAVRPLDENTGAVDENADLVEVPFDKLVAATGNKFPAICDTPGQSQAERQAEIEKISKAILSGKNVVIGGGGAIGVELTADLLEALPADTRKGKVTLVCSSNLLISDQPSYYGKKAKEVLESLGATILFDERVTSHQVTTLAEAGKPLQLTLQSGKTLDCEAYIAAFSQGPNTSWLVEPYKGNSLPDGILNDKGKIPVDGYMQSVSYDKLYAVAAVTDRKEASLGMNVDSQAKAVAANIQQAKSKTVANGMEHPVYQLVGRETFVMIIPESIPATACATCCFRWCGFPVNLFCRGTMASFVDIERHVGGEMRSLPILITISVQMLMGMPECPAIGNRGGLN